jgi:hypothetical protein
VLPIRCACTGPAPRVPSPGRGTRTPIQPSLPPSVTPCSSAHLKDECGVADPTSSAVKGTISRLTRSKDLPPLLAPVCRQQSPQLLQHQRLVRRPERDNLKIRTDRSRQLLGETPGPSCLIRPVAFLSSAAAALLNPARSSRRAVLRGVARRALGGAPRSPPAGGSLRQDFWRPHRPACCHGRPVTGARTSSKTKCTCVRRHSIDDSS